MAALLNIWIISWLFTKVGFSVEPIFQWFLYLLTTVANMTMAIVVPYARRTVCHSLRDAIIVGVFCLYVAFALTGSYLFVYPLDMVISMQNAAFYLATLLWVTPVCLGWLAFLYHYTTKARSSTCGAGGIAPRAATRRIVFFVTAAIAMLGCLIYLIAFNPAISTYDSLTVVEQAKGISPLTNWHPPLYVLLVRGLLFIWDSPVFVVFVQFTFFTLVWAALVLFLYDCGMPAWLGYVGTGMFVLLPNNGVTLVTMWKDIPYGVVLLWASLLFAKLVILPTDWQKKPSTLAQWVLCLVLLALLRQNGLVVFFILLVVLLLIAHKERRFLLMPGIASLCVFLVLGPLYTLLQVEDAPVGGKYIGLGQDILGVYFSGGKMPSDILPMVETLTDIEDYTYTPYYAFSSYSLNISMGQFIQFYVRTFINNPVLMTRVILCRMDCAWNVMEGHGAFLNMAGHTDTMDSFEEWRRLYPARVENQLTETLKFVVYRTISPNAKWFFWRCGIYTMGALSCGIVALVKKNSRLCLMMVPWIGQLISLLLSTGWADYRYYWPLFLSSVAFCLVFFVEGKNDSDKENNEMQNE